uniref:Uncharacterized protein n=2 Tax=viral metagenome TaxID=1070528 RepID=A0A6M3IJT8_9ZZZZ
MEIKGSKVLFSTGKEKYANVGIIGLGSDGDVTEGYDGGFYNPSEFLFDDEEPELTPGERIELADFMIERWSEFKIKAKREQWKISPEEFEKITRDFQRSIMGPS